jgi:UDP-N-acetyl-D-mannosaminuronic acid dehydrogenase
MKQDNGFDNLIRKIRDHRAQICVLGLGYIGLPTASMFATHGLQVLGVDVNQDVVEILNQGELHIEEPGLKTIVGAAIGSGNLKVSNSPQKSDVFIIAVPTPITAEKKADLSYVVAAAESILPHLEAGNLVILEATSPPRTTEDLLRPILERTGLKAGRDFLLAYSPERVLPGRILHELAHNSRVIGGIDPASAEAGKVLYECFVESEITCTDATTAEMVKLMENTYRDINIAAANEFSRLAEKFQVDVWEAIEIANRHPRVEILQPGPGVGGHCISVDPWFFVEKAPQEARLIRQARLVNDSQPEYVLQLLQDEFGSLKGKTLAVLGVTYKPDVDDIRESPALVIIKLLEKAGAVVKAYDPYLKRRHKWLDCLVDSMDEACSDADGIALLVNHQQFDSVKPEAVVDLVKKRFILDTRNGLDHESWRAAGFVVKVLGDGRE